MTDLLSRANVDIAINTLLDDLQPNDAIQPSDHNGLLKDILDTLSNGLSTTLRTGNTTGGFAIDITDGDNIKYNKGGSFVGVLDSLILTGSRSWNFPDNSGTIALLSDITGGDNISSANLTFDGSHYVDLSSFSWTLGGLAPIGLEKISLQNDTLIKGSNNASGTSGFKVTDINNNSLLDIRNNGQTAWGGNRVVNTAHAFYNISGSSGSLATFYESNGNVGIYLGTNGFLSTSQSGASVFKTYRQGGVSHIQLFNGATQLVELQSGTCYIAGTSLTVGSQTGVSGAKFTIQNASTNTSQQLFFANVRTTTAGRLGSSGSFGTDQKGLECFDTDINKKFVWTGSAWEQITSV